MPREFRNLKTGNRKKTLRNNTRDIMLEKVSFLDMIKNIAAKWEKATYVQKHDILEIICLNIVVTSKKQLKINIKPELESMFIRSGGQRQN